MREVLAPYADEPGESALPLRFAAALHRLVLSGQAVVARHRQGWQEHHAAFQRQPSMRCKVLRGEADGAA